MGADGAACAAGGGAVTFATACVAGCSGSFCGCCCHCVDIGFAIVGLPIAGLPIAGLPIITNGALFPPASLSGASLSIDSSKGAMLSVRLIDLDNVPDSGTEPGAEGIGPGIEPDIGAICGGAFGTAAYGFPNMFGGCTAARGESPPGTAGGAIIIGGGGCDPCCDLK